MNIILLGHDDIASKIALRFIVSQLPEHNYKLFLSGPPAAGEIPLQSRSQDSACAEILLTGLDITG
jgi:hypothetical protein